MFAFLFLIRPRVVAVRAVAILRVGELPLALGAPLVVVEAEGAAEAEEEIKKKEIHKIIFFECLIHGLFSPL